MRMKDMKTSMIIAVENATKTAVKLKPEKKSCLNEIRAHDLCDTGAVLYRLSHQANYRVN